jgi:hypothetical protein
MSWLNTSIQTGFARSASEAMFPRLFPDVGWWCPSLNPAMGGTRLWDLSGRQNWGTLTNMANDDWVVSGGKGALDFDGVNDYADLQTAGRQYPRLTQATWNFWVNFSSFSKASGYNQIAETFGTDGGQTNYQFSCLVKSNAKLAFYVFGSSAANQSNYDGTGTYTLSTNRWYMLTYVYQGGVRQEGYVDGLLDGSAANPVSSMTFSSQNVRLGFSSFGDRYPAMRFDDSRLYNRALTVGEVLQLYNVGRGNMPLRRRRRCVEQAAGGFKGYWARNNSRLIGAGNVS